MKRLHRAVQRFRWIVIGLFLLILLTCVLLYVLVHRTLAAEPKPGWDIMFLVDSSNSMSESYTIIHNQAQELLSNYLNMVTPPATCRVGLIRFGTDAQLEIPLTPTEDLLDKESLTEVWRREAVSLGWTDPLEALELGYAELYSSTRYLPTQRHVVILVTDGEPALPTLDSETARTAYADKLRAASMRLKRRHALIFTVQLGTTAEAAVPNTYLTSYRTLWQELSALTPPATYHEILDVAQLPAVVHKIAVQLTGHTPVDTFDLTSEETGSQDVELARHLRQAVFTLHSPAEIRQVGLRRPGGAEVRPSDPDVRYSGRWEARNTLVYVIEAPRPGHWTLVIDARNQIQVWVDGLTDAQIFPEPEHRLRVEAPSRLLVGTPFQATCQLFAHNEFILPHPETQVKALLSRAGFPETELLAEISEESYVLQQDGLEAGTYTLQVEALQSGKVVAAYEKLFEISTPPHLQVIHPISGQRLQSSTALTVMAEVDCLASCTSSWVSPDDSRVTGFFSGDAQERKRLALTHTLTNSVYTAVVTGLVPGRYRLEIHLRGSTVDQLPYQDVKTLSFQVLPPPPEPKNPWPWVLGSVILTFAASGGWLGWRHRQRRPHLEGRWRILKTPNDTFTARYLPLPSNRQRMTLDQTHVPGLPASFSVAAQRGPDQETEIWLTPQDENHYSTWHLSDHPLTAPTRLHDGDVLAVGPYRLRYENVRQEARQRAVGHQ